MDNWKAKEANLISDSYVSCTQKLNNPAKLPNAMLVTKKHESYISQSVAATIR